eukprot:1636238-Rhodomonas_salina.1
MTHNIRWCQAPRFRGRLTSYGRAMTRKTKSLPASAHVAPSSPSSCSSCSSCPSCPSCPSCSSSPLPTAQSNHARPPTSPAHVTLQQAGGCSCSRARACSAALSHSCTTLLAILLSVC